MSFGNVLTLNEDVEPNEPWDELEANFFSCIRRSMRAIENGKRHVDSRGNQEAGNTKEVVRGKKRRKDSRKKAGKS